MKRCSRLHVCWGIMDRLECYVNGAHIGTAYRNHNGDIHTDVDAFEKPSDLFQTCMNNYVPPSEDQLQILRYMVVYSRENKVMMQCLKRRRFGNLSLGERRPLQEIDSSAMHAHAAFLSAD